MSFSNVDLPPLAVKTQLYLRDVRVTLLALAALFITLSVCAQLLAPGSAPLYY